MWYLFFLSLILYFVIASVLRPKNLDNRSKEGVEWDNRMVVGFMILIALWIVGAVAYRAKNPVCEQAGTICMPMSDDEEFQDRPDYCDTAICK